MMRYLLCVLLSLLLGFSQAMANANNADQDSMIGEGMSVSPQEGVHVYFRIISLNPNEVELCSFYCKPELKPYDYSIPDKVSDPGTGIEFSVVAIGDRAFVSMATGNYNYNNLLRSISIPNTVKRIGKYAFFENFGLTEVDIPESVEEIGEYLFSDCTSLRSVKLSMNIKEIPECAFYNCRSLKGIEIPESCKIMGEAVFSECHSLESVKLPDSLNRIPDWAFYNCQSLATVRIPESCYGIGTGAFSHSGISKLYIPARVGALGYCIWQGCINIADIEVDPANQSFTSSDGVLYDQDLNTIIYWPSALEMPFVLPSTVMIVDPCSLEKFSEENLTIPKGVEIIRGLGIPECVDKTVTLPSTLKYISGDQWCKPSRIVIEAEYPPIVYKEDIEKSGDFTSVFENTVLEVPTKDAKLLYKNDPAWSKAFPNIVDSETLNGINGVDIDETDGKYEYFTLEGMRVTDPQPRQILIRKGNGKVEKFRY